LKLLVWTIQVVKSLYCRYTAESPAASTPTLVDWSCDRSSLVPIDVWWLLLQSPSCSLINLCLKWDALASQLLTLFGWHSQSCPTLDEFLFSAVCKLIDLQLKATVRYFVVIRYPFVVTSENILSALKLSYVRECSAVLGDKLQELREDFIVKLGVLFQEHLG
jgi:hypothetical protein